MTMDKNAALRDGSANLEASETSATGVKMGQDLVAQCYMVHVPTDPTGTNPTLDVKIQESDNGTDWRDLGVFPQITAAGNYYITLKSNADYRRHHSTLGGEDTPKFGKVWIGPVTGGQYKNW